MKYFSFCVKHFDVSCVYIGKGGVSRRSRSGGGEQGGAEPAAGNAKHGELLTGCAVQAGSLHHRAASILLADRLEEDTTKSQRHQGEGFLRYPDFVPWWLTQSLWGTTDCADRSQRVTKGDGRLQKVTFSRPNGPGHCDRALRKFTKVYVFTPERTHIVLHV